MLYFQRLQLRLLLFIGSKMDIFVIDSLVEILDELLGLSEFNLILGTILGQFFDLILQPLVMLLQLRELMGHF